MYCYVTLVQSTHMHIVDNYLTVLLGVSGTDGI